MYPLKMKTRGFVPLATKIRVMTHRSILRYGSLSLKCEKETTPVAPGAVSPLTSTIPSTIKQAALATPTRGRARWGSPCISTLGSGSLSALSVTNGRKRTLTKPKQEDGPYLDLDFSAPHSLLAMKEKSSASSWMQKIKNAPWRKGPGRDTYFFFEESFPWFLFHQKDFTMKRRPSHFTGMYQFLTKEPWIHCPFCGDGDGPGSCTAQANCLNVPLEAEGYERDVMGSPAKEEDDMFWKQRNYAKSGSVHVMHVVSNGGEARIMTSPDAINWKHVGTIRSAWANVGKLDQQQQDEQVNDWPITGFRGYRPKPKNNATKKRKSNGR